MFQFFISQLIEAKDYSSIIKTLYGEQGVEAMYQSDRLSLKDHETLFKLAQRLQAWHIEQEE